MSARRRRRTGGLELEQFLIGDFFTDDLAAGSVDNTPSVPGFGTRQVVDTENKLSLSGGNLVISAGKAAPAWGDPGIWWERDAAGLARVAGRTLGFGGFTATSLVLARLGWAANIGGDITVHAFDIDASRNLAIYDGASNLADLVTLANDTEYKLYYMLRSTGCYFFISGGVFGASPVFVGFMDTDTTTPLYPSILGNNPVALDASDAVVRDLTALAPLYSDTFSDTSAPYLSDGLVEPSATDTPGAGSGVTILGDTHRAAANKATASITPGSELLSNPGFDDWTGVPPNDQPDGWATTEVGDATSTVTENPAGECQIISDVALAEIRQNVMVVGGIHQITVIVSARTSGQLTVQAGGVDLDNLNSTGTFLFTNRPGTTSFLIKRVGGVGSNMTLDSVSIKQLQLADCLVLHDTGFVDAYKTCKYTIEPDTQAGVAIMWDSASNPQNGIIAYFDRVDSKVKLVKYVAGSPTELAAVADSYNAGARITLRVVPETNTVYVEYDDTAIAAVVVSDAGIINNTLDGRFRTHNDSGAEVELGFRTLGNEAVGGVV